jgi:hypothetical protein
MNVVKRRTVLGGLLAAPLGAIPLRQTKANNAQGKLLLVDATLSMRERLAISAPRAAGTLRVIERDLVRQWRRDLRRALAASAGAVALVRWDKSFVLAGLAREERWRTLSQPIGRGLFRIEVII